MLQADPRNTGVMISIARVDAQAMAVKMVVGLTKNKLSHIVSCGNTLEAPPQSDHMMSAHATSQSA
eukprot:SAG31_NODE_3109_length_4665_cov_2.150022_2_plen_66_part_00